MPELEDDILRYPTLSPERQREVEERVEAHPEWAPLLREAKALGRLMQEARRFREEPPSDDVVAYYLIAERTDPHAIPADLEAAVERVKTHIEEHPEAQERLAAFERRMREIEEKTEDPAAQFERLTGRTLSHDEEASARDSGRTPAPDREPARIYQLAGRWSRRAAVAALVLAVLYGVLFWAGRAAQPETERLAALSEEELAVEGYSLRTRSKAETLDSASVDAVYLRGLGALREARTTTLGLFPRYDEENLQQAEQMMEEVVSRAKPDSFLQLEAYYFLGKARLAQGKVAEARQAFQEVVAGQGRKTSEAQSILKELESG